MTTVKLSSKNQIVIPAEARRQLNVHAGDELLVVPKGPTVILVPKPNDTVKALRGAGRGLYGRADRYLRRERRSWRRRPSARS